MPNYKQNIAQIFSGVASTYNEAAIVEHEIGSRLLERLDLINLSPEIILDLGGGTGYFTCQLAHRYKNANILYCDLAFGMAQYAHPSFINSKNILTLCGDAEYIPLSNNSVDFIFSNCVFQWCLDVNQLFKEIHRILKPGGLFLFSTFGPDTLMELQHSIDSIENQNHHPLFIDMHIIGDVLLHAGFQDPVMDVDTLILTYPTFSLLLNDLKLSGSAEYYDALSIHKNSISDISFKKNLEDISKKYDTFKTPKMLLPATFEIVYGHAWGAEKKTVKDPNIYHIPLTEIGYT